MKVREVIEQLKTYDPELPIVMDGEEGGITEEQVIIRLISIERFKNKEECELIGEHAVPKQVRRLLEGRILRQLVYVDSAVGQYARFSVNPTDSGVRRNNSFQALPRDSSRHSLRISPLH